MTVLIPGFDLQKTNQNPENNHDTSSTQNMIFPDSVNTFNKMSKIKILSGTLIIITLLMGLFLLSATYIQTSSRCVCDYGLAARTMQESQNSPYFEPLKSLSSSETSKEMRNLPLRIKMHGDAGNLVNGNMNGGRVSCEVTRKTASQVIASEPREVQTPFGNMTTDPKLLHLNSEKLFFTCYNGEKPKPVVLIARPRIFAIFHRTLDNNSTDTDENNTSEAEFSSSKKQDNLKSNSETANNLEDKQATSKNEKESLVRNKRETTKQTMECSCNCPIKNN